MQVTRAELLELIHAAQNEAYATHQAPPRRRSCIGAALDYLIGISFLFLVPVLIALGADHFGLIPSTVVDRIEPPQLTFSMPALPTAALGPAAPAQERHTRFYATAVPVFAGDLVQPTPTWMPTQEGSFWTPEEQTAFPIEATATTEAFYNEIPTAPPEFVGYTLEQCRDAEKVAQSGLLQMWCK